MKLTVLAIAMLISLCNTANAQPLVSKVYSWETSPVKSNKTGSSKKIFSGSLLAGVAEHDTKPEPSRTKDVSNQGHLGPGTSRTSDTSDQVRLRPGTQRIMVTSRAWKPSCIVVISPPAQDQDRQTGSDWDPIPDTRQQ